MRRRPHRHRRSGVPVLRQGEESVMAHSRLDLEVEDVEGLWRGIKYGCIVAVIVAVCLVAFVACVWWSIGWATE